MLLSKKQLKFNYKIDTKILNKLGDIREYIYANFIKNLINGKNKKTLKKINKAKKYFNKIFKMTQRIDYLLSGDDSEETFNERWNEEKL